MEEEHEGDHEEDGKCQLYSCYRSMHTDLIVQSNYIDEEVPVAWQEEVWDDDDGDKYATFGSIDINEVTFDSKKDPSHWNVVTFSSEITPTEWRDAAYDENEYKGEVSFSSREEPKDWDKGTVVFNSTMSPEDWVALRGEPYKGPAQFGSRIEHTEFDKGTETFSSRTRHSLYDGVPEFDQ